MHGWRHAVAYLTTRPHHAAHVKSSLLAHGVVTLVTMALLIAFGSFAAGLLGALTGLGGGIVVVPMLTLLFHVPLRFAIGASLVSVIAMSSGAAAAYVREGYTNVRIGIFLEVATTIGAVTGAAISGYVPTS